MWWIPRLRLHQLERVCCIRTIVSALKWVSLGLIMWGTRRSTASSGWKCKRGLPHIFRLPQHWKAAKGEIFRGYRKTLIFISFLTKHHFTFITPSEMIPGTLKRCIYSSPLIHGWACPSYGGVKVGVGGLYIILKWSFSERRMLNSLQGLDSCAHVWFIIL